MHLSMLRSHLFRIVSLLSVTLFSILLWLTTPAQAQNSELKKVKIAVGTSNLNLTYPWLMMPLALGA